MNTRIIILALLALALVAGCGKSDKPGWPGGSKEVPVTESQISPTPAAPTKSQPVSSKEIASSPASSQPASEKKTPEALPTPLTETGQAAVTQTLTQTDPGLLTLTAAKASQTPVNLSSMKPIDSPPKAQPIQTPPSEPIALSDLSQEIVEQTQALSTETPEPEKIEVEKPLQLAPISEPDEQFEADLEGYPNGANPAFGPVVNPQDDPEPNTPPDSAEELPWNLNRQRMAEEEKKVAKLQAQQTIDEIDLAQPVKDEPIVLNRPEIVAGQTLQVNNKYITVDDLLAALHPSLERIPKNLSEEAFRSQVARVINSGTIYQVQQVIVNAEAEKYLEEAAKAQVDQEMEDTLRDMIALAGGSKEKLKQKCLRDGTTLDYILQNQRMNLTVTIYLQAKFYPAIVVNRRMLWNYYRANQSEFKSEKKVQMQIIAQPFATFLPKGKQPTAEELTLAKKKAKQEITKAWDKLQAGEDFTKVAKELSRGLRANQGGTWPMMAAGNFRNAEVEAEAFKLAEGTYSKIIETPTGFYIVKAQDVEHGKEVPFEQAQETIERKLREEQFLDLRAEYMKNLYEKATIGDTRSFMMLAVEQAVRKYYR